jgi:hypothetical protein
VTEADKAEAEPGRQPKERRDFSMTVDTSDTEIPADWHGLASAPVDPETAFNGFVAATVIRTLDELGVLDQLARHPVLDIASFVRSTGVGRHEQVLREILRAAETCGYHRITGDEAALTEAGREVIRMRGYFTWAVGGYHDVFAQAARIATGASAFGGDVRRDEAMVALGSGQNDRSFMAGTLEEVLAGVDFTTIADLGSGISARLSRVVGERQGTRGVGLDISGPATELAGRTIAEAGLTGRVTAIQADVLDIVRRDRHVGVLAEVDTVMSFFLLHDLLADPQARPHLFSRLREAFPAVRTFVLADTMLRPDSKDARTLPFFSLGYELAHGLMGIPLHSRETYEELFAAVGLSVRSRVPFGTPHSWLYVLDAT